jgi:tRNA(adenine34) deaminase
MRGALAMAAKAPKSGDVPIGAVLVSPDGKLIASACNAREALADPTAHAEILVLRDAARQRGEWRLTGCTVYVTIEPCTMCAGALVAARVGRIVFGAFEPKTGAVASLWDVVRDRRLSHRPQVRAGVLADEAAHLMKDFFAAHRQ